MRTINKEREPNLLEILWAAQIREDERWWQAAIEEALIESVDISAEVFHEQRTETVNFSAPRRRARVLPPTLITRPRDLFP